MVKRSAGELLFSISVDRSSAKSITGAGLWRDQAADRQRRARRRQTPAVEPHHRQGARHLAHHGDRRLRAADVGRADRLAHRLRLLRLRRRREPAAARGARRSPASGRRKRSSPTSSPRRRRASSSAWRIRRSRAPSSPACRRSTRFRWRSGRGCRQNTGAQSRDLIMGYSDPNGLVAAAPARSPSICAPTGASPATPSRSSSSTARSRPST